MTYHITNLTRRVLLADRADRADNLWTRAVGLLGRAGLAKGEGIEITRCSGVHTFFMRFAIDVIFVDGEGTVLRTVPGLKPWRATPFVSAASRVIELPVGTIAASGTVAGDQLVVAPVIPSLT